MWRFLLLLLLGYAASPACAGDDLRTQNIALIGDSMTAEGSGYFREISQLAQGQPVEDLGVGGQRAAEIAVRVGAKPLVLHIVGNRILATGKTWVVPDQKFLRAGGVSSVRVSLDGGLFNLGLLNDRYFVEPITKFQGPISVVGPVSATVLSLVSRTEDASDAAALADVESGTVVIRAGRNDVGKGNFNAQQVIDDIELMASHARLTASSVIVLGVTNGYRDLPKDAGGAIDSKVLSARLLGQVSDLNRKLSEKYGSDFLDPLANHADHGGAEEHIINGKTFIVLTESVLVDGIHENANGKAQTAKLVYDKIVSLHPN